MPSRLATLANKFSDFEARLSVITRRLDRDDRDDIADAKRDNGINTLATDLGSAAAEYDRLKDRVETLERENRRLRNQPAPNTAALEQRIRDLEDARRDLEDANRRLDDANRDLRDQLRRRAPLPPTPVPADDRLLRDVIRRLQTENERLVTDNATLQARKEAVKRERDGYKAQRDGYKTERDDLQKKVDNFDANWPRQTGCGDCQARRDHRCVRDMRFKKKNKK